jgi:neural Wiskott-Aldrich syndrome protein
MSSDPNKKSPRTFQCRDMLWETFEQMARELECSVDYLINEAMKQYARQRSYGQRTPYPGTARESSQDSRGGFASAPPPPMPPPPSMRASGVGAGRAMGGLPPPPARSGGLPAPPPPPRNAGMGSGIGMGMPPGRMGGSPVGGRSQPPSAPRSAPPPIPGGRGSTSMPPLPGQSYNGGLGPGASGGGAQLSIIYQGEKVAVAKDRFVIGRGKQSSDLTLKDPNVSRQHAMIEYQNGVYFMVDMGSTNGVEYNGQRIARKQIAEGDVFRICDHDLRFTYR